MARSPVGRSFDRYIEERIRQQPAFADGLLEEAVQAMLDDEIGAARNLIRNVIKGSVGYAELARSTGTPEKSLVRMFGPRGNPTAANLFSVLAHLQRRVGVRLHVASRRVKGSATPRSRARRAA